MSRPRQRVVDTLYRYLERLAAGDYQALANELTSRDWLDQLEAPASVLQRTNELLDELRACLEEPGGDEDHARRLIEKIRILWH